MKFSIKIQTFTAQLKFSPILKMPLVIKFLSAKQRKKSTLHILHKQGGLILCVQQQPTNQAKCVHFLLIWKARSWAWGENPLFTSKAKAKPKAPRGRGTFTLFTHCTSQKRKGRFVCFSECWE